LLPIDNAGQAGLVVFLLHGSQGPQQVVKSAGRAASHWLQQFRSTQDKARWLATIVLDDLAVGGLRRIARDAQMSQQCAVEHRRIPVVGNGQPLTRSLVKLVASGISAFLQPCRINFGNIDDSARGQDGSLSSNVHLDICNRMKSRNRAVPGRQSRHYGMGVAVD